MAKSSKVEDYWRQHNIENLFKELTQILVRRMPPDPAIAIVEHLQKKFPKSFKTSTNNLQMSSMTSPHSDVQNESMHDLQIERRLSNQSQVSGIVTIPTVGSAFTDLFKQDTDSSRQAPELNIRNLVFANRLSQQAVRMGKNIRSNRDILDEEVIKPTNTKSTVPSTTDGTVHSVAEDHQNAETHEEPTVKQLIKYKQQLRTENDRRFHRENLAQLAKQQRDKEHFFQSDLMIKPDDIKQQQEGGANELSSQGTSEETGTTNAANKPVVKSKEEEEILNDENVFQPRRHRFRGKYRNKLPTSGENTPYQRRRPMTDLRSTMRRDDGNLVCKVCGNVVTGEENQSKVNSQQVSAPPTARPFEVQPSAQSVESTGGTVDDWFESASDVFGSRQVSPWTPDDAILPPTGSSTFRRSLFQPIKDDNSNIVEHQPPARPLIPINDETKTKRLTSPRISESGIFARSPEPKIRPPSSSRSIPSPVTKKHQTDTVPVTSHQLAKTITQPSPTRSLLSTTNERRMSGWSVREHSPDDTDEN